VRRGLVIFAVAVATCVSTTGLSAQASSEPARAAGNHHLVRTPDGQLVTVRHGAQGPKHRSQPKAAPPATTVSSTAGMGCTYRTTNQYFCHAGAYQSVTSDGAYMSTTVESPWVETGDTHSLAELAVESSDQQQIIEIGWTVDTAQWDETPRLFIYHWINGQGTCYNSGCGFVQDTSTTITPGMALTPSSTPVQFAIEYYQGNWWYGYNGTWFGYLPESSVWGGTFTQAGLVQEFGEVASTTSTPCTDMGNGYLGTDTAAAAVTGVGYYNSTTPVSLARSTVDDSSLYDSQVTSANSFRYGGPGAC
jgi:Neprosin